MTNVESLQAALSRESYQDKPGSFSPVLFLNSLRIFQNLISPSRAELCVFAVILLEIGLLYSCTSALYYAAAVISIEKTHFPHTWKSSVNLFRKDFLLQKKMWNLWTDLLLCERGRNSAFMCFHSFSLFLLPASETRIVLFPLWCIYRWGFSAVF